MNIITIREAAQRLNYSDTNIRNAIKSEALAATRLGRSWAIKESDFALYVKALPIERRALVLVRGFAVERDGLYCPPSCVSTPRANGGVCDCNNSNCVVNRMIDLVSEVQDDSV